MNKIEKNLQDWFKKREKITISHNFIKSRIMKTLLT